MPESEALSVGYFDAYKLSDCCYYKGAVSCPNIASLKDDAGPQTRDSSAVEVLRGAEPPCRGGHLDLDNSMAKDTADVLPWQASI